MSKFIGIILAIFCVFSILSHMAGNGPVMSQPDIRTEQVDARPTDYDDEIYNLKNECNNINMAPNDVLRVFNDQTPQEQSKMYHYITKVYDGDVLSNLNKRTVIDSYIQSFND